jgi:hypothetical protein
MASGCSWIAASSSCHLTSFPGSGRRRSRRSSTSSVPGQIIFTGPTSMSISASTRSRTRADIPSGPSTDAPPRVGSQTTRSRAAPLSAQQRSIFNSAVSKPRAALDRDRLGPTRVHPTHSPAGRHSRAATTDPRRSKARRHRRAPLQAPARALPGVMASAPRRRAPPSRSRRFAARSPASASRTAIRLPAPVTHPPQPVLPALLADPDDTICAQPCPDHSLVFGQVVLPR